MAAEKGNETPQTGPKSKTIEQLQFELMLDKLEETYGLASPNFDPMRVIYGPDSDFDHEYIQLMYEKDRKRRSSSAAASKPESSPSHEFTKQTPAIDCINTDVDENTADMVAAESVSQPDEKEPQCETEELGNKNEKKPQSRRTQGKKKVLTQMKDGFERGPLNILKRSLQEKLKVRIWARNIGNVRGVSTDYYVAFDEHLNLAMVDVEVYRKSSKKSKGRRHKKKKQPKDEAAPPAEALYPKTPWKTISRQAGGLSTEAGDATECPEDMNWVDNSSKDNVDSHVSVNPPADGIGNLTSQFRGMHMFDENETTILLGVKSKKLWWY